ncbi:MAG: hypothetical protein QXQ57_06520 [Sulfolobales archaeon]
MRAYLAIAIAVIVAAAAAYPFLTRVFQTQQPPHPTPTTAVWRPSPLEAFNLSNYFEASGGVIKVVRGLSWREYVKAALIYKDLGGSDHIYGSDYFQVNIGDLYIELNKRTSFPSSDDECLEVLNETLFYRDKFWRDLRRPPPESPQYMFEYTGFAYHMAVEGCSYLAELTSPNIYSPAALTTIMYAYATLISLASLLNTSLDEAYWWFNYETAKNVSLYLLHNETAGLVFRAPEDVARFVAVESRSSTVILVFCPSLWLVWNDLSFMGYQCIFFKDIAEAILGNSGAGGYKAYILKYDPSREGSYPIEIVSRIFPQLSSELCKEACKRDAILAVAIRGGEVVSKLYLSKLMPPIAGGRVVLQDLARSWAVQASK